MAQKQKPRVLESEWSPGRKRANSHPLAHFPLWCSVPHLPVAGQRDSPVECWQTSSERGWAAVGAGRCRRELPRPVMTHSERFL